jgi:signal transduction histidine kinase
MSSGVTFQTRARTIDHLGRGQIADLPTAITELWKNAYDAYARGVALHIFDGTPEVAAIFDDGCGMDRTDFVERWLVIGTESKITSKADGDEERLGLPPRPRLGEKGIGRLSAAFIAPITLVVSRKPGGRFTAALVDWRLFENPYLSLADIRLPLEEFDDPAEFAGLLPDMLAVLHENIHGSEDQERKTLLTAAWRRFSELERENGSERSTADAILAIATLPIGQSHLNEWPVFVGLQDHGTAMLMVGIQHGLSVWLKSGSDSDANSEVKERLRDTLTAFTDPLSKERIDFGYEVFVHKDGRGTRILGSAEVFGYDDFLALEHQVDGTFDDDGVFTGRIVAYGKDFGIKQIPPREPPPRGAKDRIGPFIFCIGTFAPEALKTTHTPERHIALLEQASKFGGLNFYRDDLRVMPYGRPDADFLNIEERRGRHQGRYFWAHRRSFGRIAVTRAGNSNLKDKAGREGLVDNRARQTLRNLVTNVLVEVAKRYFGTDSEPWRDVLPDIIKRNAAARAAAEKARTRRRVDLRKFLSSNSQPLRVAVDDVRCIREDLDGAADPERVGLAFARLKDLTVRKQELRPPPAPAKTSDLEDDYRQYRDGYMEFHAGLEDLGKHLLELEASIGSSRPDEIVQRNFSSRQSLLSGQVGGWLQKLETRMGALKEKWLSEADEDRSIFYKMCRPLLDEDIDAIGLTRLLNLIDAQFREQGDAIAARYEPYLKALEQLEAGIDIEGAFVAADDDRTEIEERVRDLNTVAQLGITVEIIGHELEMLDGEVRRNLMRLPAEIRTSSAYKLAYESHAALTERLRFLAPMKIAGYRARETITGARITDYITEFFERTFRDDRIIFTATPAFRQMQISDLPSRIYPAFINLVNNAAYWVAHAAERRIILDLVDGKVVVADSGPGVDPDDEQRLFSLFFTRRRAGRGVGLYLARANLAVANHRIRYAQKDDPHLLPGANFIIEFKGVSDV